MMYQYLFCEQVWIQEACRCCLEGGALGSQWTQPLPFGPRPIFVNRNYFKFIMAWRKKRSTPPQAQAYLFIDSKKILIEGPRGVGVEVIEDGWEYFAFMAINHMKTNTLVHFMPSFQRVLPTGGVLSYNFTRGYLWASLTVGKKRVGGL